MNFRNLAIGGVALFAAAFLLGFVPQRLTSRDLRQQLESTRRDLAVQSDDMQRHKLGLLIGRVYLETNRKNFGLASQYSTQFFDAARAAASSNSDPNWQSLLRTMLTQRDAVTGGLAKADAGTAEVVQGMFQQVLAALNLEKK